MIYAVIILISFLVLIIIARILDNKIYPAGFDYYVVYYSDQSIGYTTVSLKHEIKNKQDIKELIDQIEKECSESNVIISNWIRL